MTTKYIAELVRTCPTISEIWLMGSRANGRARHDSDWDYLAFADDIVLGALRSNPALDRPEIDLLVVLQGTRFASPWRRPDAAGRLKWKKASLLAWKWTRLSETEARYRGTLLTSTPTTFDVRDERAYRVWPQLPVRRRGRP